MRVVRGAAIAAFVPDLARLRIEVFRDFPYLYDGSDAYERSYLQTYVDAPHAVAVLAFDGDAVVGASTGLPMADATAEFRAPFAAARIPVDGMFYCGESVLRTAYRGRGIYPRFFAEREGHARSLGFATCAFSAVERPGEHPLRPPRYRPLDPLWRRFGYRREPALRATVSWKDLDCSAESAKPMVFWLKELGP